MSVALIRPRAWGRKGLPRETECQLSAWEAPGISALPWRWFPDNRPPTLQDPGRPARTGGCNLAARGHENTPLFAEQMTVLNYGIKRDLAAYLQGRPGIEVRNLADLIAFNRNYPGEEGYGQQLLEDAQALDIGESAYWETANKLRDESRKVLDVAHHVHQLDAVIDLSGGQLQGVGAQAGYPGLQVSAGQDAARQPVGLYFWACPGVKKCCFRWVLLSNRARTDIKRTVL